MRIYFKPEPKHKEIKIVREFAFLPVKLFRMYEKPKGLLWLEFYNATYTYNGNKKEWIKIEACAIDKIKPQI